MISNERATKKTKQNKKLRMQQKDRQKGNKIPNFSVIRPTKKMNELPQKGTEKQQKKGYESFGSDENVDDQFEKTKAITRQRQAFYFSAALPIKERIQIFRNDFPEFNSLEDEETKQLILLYDHNLI